MSPVDLPTLYVSTSLSSHLNRHVHSICMNVLSSVLVCKLCYVCTNVEFVIVITYVYQHATIDSLL